jgi:hypothetical protein
MYGYVNYFTSEPFHLLNKKKNSTLFSDEAPTLFILFISSHGNADGKILTERKVLIEGKKEYESFTTESVFRALRENSFLKDALKLVFIGVSFKVKLWVQNSNMRSTFNLRVKLY